MMTIKQRSIQRSGITINLRSLYSVAIGLLPVIMVWNIPIINIGASTVLLGILAPYALSRYREGGKKISMLPFLGLVGYLMIRASGSLVNQFLLLIVLIHVYGAVNGSLNIRVMRKTLEVVAVAATACVVLQTLLYYVLGIRTMLLIKALVLSDNHDYFSSYLVGMYRPAAFFLEPSHYTQYCCLGLLSVLFPLEGEKANLKKAVWIALGCLLTTSGMGIVLCIGVFGWYILFTKRKMGTKIKTIFGWGVVAVIAFAILMQFSFFSLAVQRVVGKVDGYNAIWGRTLFWNEYIGSLSGSNAVFGKGLTDLPEGYMTGLMKLIYCYGYVGAGLLLAVLAYLFIKSRNTVAHCICVVYCGLMCIENLFGFIPLVFWFSAIIGSGSHNDFKYAIPEKK